LSKRHIDFVIVAEESAFAIVDYNVVQRRKVMFADVEFAAFGWNDRKVMNSISVLH